MPIEAIRQAIQAGLVTQKEMATALGIDSSKMSKTMAGLRRLSAIEADLAQKHLARVMEANSHKLKHNAANPMAKLERAKIPIPGEPIGDRGFDISGDFPRHTLQNEPARTDAGELIMEETRIELVDLLSQLPSKLVPMARRLLVGLLEADRKDSADPSSRMKTS